MLRRDFLGNTVSTTLSANISNVATSISLTNGATFPTGNDGSFVISINRGSSSEEKVLISSRSGDTLTVEQRGYDGTVANSHTANIAIVDHVLDALTIKDMNRVTYDNLIMIWMGE